MVVNEPPPLALEASLGHPNSDTRIDTGYSSQLVKHFVHALQPDAVSARTIIPHHLLNAHRTTMRQSVRDNRLRHDLIKAATSRVGHS
jgi:hypothetical protein